MAVTTVRVVGSSPAAEAIRAALGDADVAVRDGSARDVGDADLAVVVGVAGSAGFGTANEVALATETPWIAVEIGGIGGIALGDVDASVATFGPDGGCYRCLAARVASNVDAEGDVGESPGAARSAVRLAGAHAGERAVRAAAGADLAGTVLELPHAERAFLPVPGCDACGGERDHRLDLWDDESFDLQRAVDRAERAVDGRVGVVSGVGERESFPAPYYLASVCDTSGFSDAEAPRRTAGVAADWDGAYVKALGEALERYAAGVYREADFDTAPAGATDGIRPGEFVRPAGYETPDDDAPVRWVPGTDLRGGGGVRLPAEFVHFPPPDERYGPAITTGLGLGSSAVDALLSGLYEVVERDAAMLSWYSTFEPMGLAVEDDAFAELAKRARSEDLTVAPLLVTQDVDVPVVAVAVHREEWPRFAVGSAADLDPDAAATGALCEAIQNWMELRAIGPERAAEQEGAIGRYADFPREVRGYVDPDATVPTDSVGPAEVPSGRAELDAVLDRLADADLDAYAARLTPRDVEALGFEAVRALVPAAQPLFVDTDEPFFGERARTVPRELGFEPRLDRPFHPFP